MDTTANVVTDRVYTGGQIASIGFEQQDLVGIKYAFKYLDAENGLDEISFETENDFVIVLKDSTKISAQVKIKALSITLIKSLQKDLDLSQKNIIIGSYEDEDFRNLRQKKEAVIAMLQGKTFEKDKIMAGWTEHCNRLGLDPNFVLSVDFDTVDPKGKYDNAIGAIAAWADKRKMIIDANGLLKDLEVHVKHCRCNRASLSEKEIKNIIAEHGTVKYESGIITPSNNLS
ncbi:hypothetical protein [Butyrivibrio sp. FC2001]|uniref:hypothetical protein n=1 Tax=Butyrivibrio sp. FC2001 TaxID=1280671 RepID=UPI00041E08B7|nr:hypothetical protein [Butyrivibrio sp. FC2001]